VLKRVLCLLLLPLVLFAKPKGGTLHCVHGLSFASAIAGGYVIRVTPPSSAMAARFVASGARGQRFILRVVGRNMILHPVGQGGRVIRVSEFRFGGSVSVDGKGRLGRDGQRGNIRLGASAEVAAQCRPGRFAGRARLRITYI
jgi:hypothetical protein